MGLTKEMGLTTEQRMKIDNAIASLKERAMRTDPIKQDECIAAFNAAYAAREMSPPEYVFCASPWEIVKKMEGMFVDEAAYRATLGEVLVIGDDFVPDATLIYKRKWGDVPYQLDTRVDKLVEALREMARVVDDALAENAGPIAELMIDDGYASLWSDSHTIGRRDAYVALGILPLPEFYAEDYGALATCHRAYSYEQYCFICDRPKSFTHPAFTKGETKNRVIISWRDGFEFKADLLK